MCGVESCMIKLSDYFSSLKNQPRLNRICRTTISHQLFSSRTVHYLIRLHQLTSGSTWWCYSRPRWGWFKMAVGLPEGPSYPGYSPSFFRYAAPERPQKGSRQLLQNRSPVFSFVFLLLVFVSLLFFFS